MGEIVLLTAAGTLSSYRRQHIRRSHAVRTKIPFDDMLKDIPPATASIVKNVDGIGNRARSWPARGPWSSSSRSWSRRGPC